MSSLPGACTSLDYPSERRYCGRTVGTGGTRRAVMPAGYQTQVPVRRQWMQQPCLMQQRQPTAPPETTSHHLRSSGSKWHCSEMWIIQSNLTISNSVNSKSPLFRSQADSPLSDRDLVLTQLFRIPAILNFFSCPVGLQNSEVRLYYCLLLKGRFLQMSVGMWKWILEFPCTKTAMHSMPLWI